MLHIPGADFQYQAGVAGNGKDAEDFIDFRQIIRNFLPAHGCITNHAAIDTNERPIFFRIAIIDLHV